jgi:glc operon protein GlcG
VVDPATAPTQCRIATPLAIFELRQETFDRGDCYLFMTTPIHRQSRRHEQDRPTGKTMTDYTHTASTKIAAIGAMILALAIALNVRAAEVTTQHTLTLDAARTVIAAAEAEALQKGWPCVIAVTDSAGYLIALDRMDASPMLASVELAPAKARTAALFRKPSKALEDAIHAGRTAAVTAGYVEMSGGLPLIVNGEIVGAIGVSSAQPDWDTAIAAAGAAILAAKRTN